MKNKLLTTSHIFDFNKNPSAFKWIIHEQLVCDGAETTDPLPTAYSFTVCLDERTAKISDGIQFTEQNLFKLCEHLRTLYKLDTQNFNIRFLVSTVDKESYYIYSINQDGITVNSVEPHPEKVIGR